MEAAAFTVVAFTVGLSDLNMPGVTGIEFIQAARNASPESIYKLLLASRVAKLLRKRSTMQTYSA